MAQGTLSYKIVDTGQEICYDSLLAITPPNSGELFYGQDAQYNGYQPSYTDNGDGTITDNVTGLMWQKTPDQNGDGVIDYDDKMSYEEALAAADTFSLAGYSDWRLPTLKEQYSLILFSGTDPSGYEGTSTAGLVPFIDIDYFDFGYGDLSADERLIDAQYATSTLYVSTTMMNDETMFGVNFADGRIKGYPIGPMPGQTEDKQFYVTYVRGISNYGVNDFEDNGDGTITDHATGLMWMQDDNEGAVSWQDALVYAETAEIAGYDDWRLPNAKELQSIVDYTRSPATTNSAAIDPLFNCSIITDEGGVMNFPFYWSNTTHANYTETPGNAAAYVCFGEALGWMEMPSNSGNYTLMDVHGAGAQRSDFKTGDPNNYPYGHGPQGDVVRIFNFVRLVRDDSTSLGVGSVMESDRSGFSLNSVFPNPANEQITLNFTTNSSLSLDFELFDMCGNSILSLSNKAFQKGESSISINVDQIPAGIYFLQLDSGQTLATKKIIIR
ncbi:MAG TPA: DUF1566 domain-containing protein [Bacteroidales bacterium]|nr:DUF1566 domain-containing protein [Bacteroidales bacterium]HRX96670.1 DUF1566 domain-containing protein [Bacteroidales bacterium]